METISQALTREHHVIDHGLEAFASALEHDDVDAPAVLRVIDALRRHIYLEERFVFPSIREAGVLMPILVMVREHGEIWRLMDALVGLLEPDGRPLDRDRLTTTCQELLSRLEQHNAKEEPVVYPHADTDLSDDETRALDQFLRDGTTPVGWICEAAR